MQMTATRSNARTVALGWEAVGRGDWDTLVADYVEDMLFVMPGQSDELHGKSAFREVLNGLGDALPPGFAISAIRQIGDGDEVVSVVDWTSAKVPGGSQFAVLFRFEGALIREERWFLDTEQWKAAF